MIFGVAIGLLSVAIAPNARAQVPNDDDCPDLPDLLDLAYQQEIDNDPAVKSAERTMDAAQADLQKLSAAAPPADAAADSTQAAATAADSAAATASATAAASHAAADAAAKGNHGAAPGVYTKASADAAASKTADAAAKTADAAAAAAKSRADSIHKAIDTARAARKKARDAYEKARDKAKERLDKRYGHEACRPYVAPAEAAKALAASRTGFVLEPLANTNVVAFGIAGAGAGIGGGTIVSTSPTMRAGWALPSMIVAGEISWTSINSFGGPTLAQNAVTVGGAVTPFFWTSESGDARVYGSADINAGPVFVTDPKSTDTAFTGGFTLGGGVDWFVCNGVAIDAGAGAQTQFTPWSGTLYVTESIGAHLGVLFFTGAPACHEAPPKAAPKPAASTPKIAEEPKAATPTTTIVDAEKKPGKGRSPLFCDGKDKCCIDGGNCGSFIWRAIDNGFVEDNDRIKIYHQRYKKAVKARPCDVVFYNDPENSGNDHVELVVDVDDQGNVTSTIGQDGHNAPITVGPMKSDGQVMTIDNPPASGPTDADISAAKPPQGQRPNVTNWESFLKKCRERNTVDLKSLK